MSENIFGRFPCKPNEYCKIVGSLLAKLVADMLEGFGFRTEVNVTNKDEADIKVYQNDQLIIVGETLNWSISSKLSTSRIEQIIRNLSQYDNRCRKALFYSVPIWNVAYWAHQNRVDLVCFGFQILPEDFYDFFYEKNIVEQTEPLNDDTKNAVKEKIEEYLRAKNLLQITPETSQSLA